MLLGLFSGSVLRFIDMRIKEAIVHSPRDVRPYSYFFIGSFVAVLVNSVGFSSVYTSLLLLFAAIVLLVFSRYIKLPLG